jgi:serine/threonine protein kinase, bacterial
MRGEADVDGTAFGRYQLLQVLGRGGMGEVWRAHDTATDRIVAIKLLPAQLADDETFAQRFRREAHAAARLNSPHVIPIHNYGEIDGRLYVDMRLIEGRDLQTVLADGPLEPARAVRIIEQVAKALNAAHEVGLVHRDVKPSNILLDKDDYAYLIDFGIARLAGETGLTGTGGVIGTWHYLAPERLGAREADARADIYALACVLYECLTGRRPYPGDSGESQVAGHLNAPPPRPSSARPQLPHDVDAVIAKGMAKDPDQRYASTVELAHAAHDAITTPIPQPAPHHPPPPRRAAPTAAAGTVASAPSPAAPRPPVPTPAASTLASRATQQARPHDVATVRQPPPIDRAHPPPQPSPPKWWRRKTVMIPAAAGLLAVIALVAGVIITGTGNQDQPTASPRSPEQTAASPRSPQQTAPPRETELPIPPPCTDYQFTPVALRQSDGYTVELQKVGFPNAATATGPDGSTQYGSIVSGGVTGRRVDFTIQWAKGPRGRYTGDIDDSGFAHGTGVDEVNPGRSSTWDSTDPFMCANPR